MKVDLELTDNEMLALGYALACGIQRADERRDVTVLDALHTLAMKIHQAGTAADKREGERIP